MIRHRVRTVWSSLSDEARVGLASGLVLSFVLAGTVAVHREAALGMPVIPYGIRAGTTTVKLDDLRRGVVLLYPGFFVGVGAGIWWYVRRGAPPSRRSQAIILAALTAVPVATTVVLGLVGFFAVVGALLVEGGVVAGILMGGFFGSLVLGVALGGALILSIGTLLLAGIGLTVGYGLTVVANQ